jgi:hypothetical protein
MSERQTKEMTQEDILIISKINEDIQNKLARFKSNPNDTYRDELIQTITEIVKLISECVCYLYVLKTYSDDTKKTKLHKKNKVNTAKSST